MISQCVHHTCLSYVYILCFSETLYAILYGPLHVYCLYWLIYRYLFQFFFSIAFAYVCNVNKISVCIFIRRKTEKSLSVIHNSTLWFYLNDFYFAQIKQKNFFLQTYANNEYMSEYF